MESLMMKQFDTPDNEQYLQDARRDQLVQDLGYLLARFWLEQKLEQGNKAEEGIFSKRQRPHLPMRGGRANI